MSHIVKEQYICYFVARTFVKIKTENSNATINNLLSYLLYHLFSYTKFEEATYLKFGN
jgi:hypothetical protein